MIRLGVNIDHVATLRQARGTRYPDQVQATIDRFLQRQKDLPEGLRTYALNAYRGCVL